jgi:hypothetical protein
MGELLSRKKPASTTFRHFQSASLSVQGMGEALLLDGSADAAAFETYVEQILAPSLRPGQIVLLDNLSIQAENDSAKRGRAHARGAPGRDYPGVAQHYLSGCARLVSALWLSRS